jgi:DNA mismatch repair protein MutL
LIHILSEALASRIAAGEVIERPASVAKELVENSLDAGAMRIDVTVEGGGLRLIRVVDNGCGISTGQIGLAFERFATSKINEDSDLSDIRSMGFRGEALPSIASVAEVDAVSRQPGHDAGARYEVRFGEAMSPVPAGAPVGTSITVQHLFRNVPARLKFVASPTSESTRIHEVLAGLALARPEVGFSLRVDGKERLSTPGSGEPRDVIAALYGPAVAASMISLTPGDDSPFSASGLISSPSSSRGNRRYITIAANGRLVQSRRVSFAIEQAYHGYLPERRFPIAVVYITAPFEDIDVNVHPTKAEVRFLREQLVFSTVQQTVRAALAEMAPVHRVVVSGQSGIGADATTTGERRLFEEAAWPAPDDGANAANGSYPNAGSVANGASVDISEESSASPSTHRSVLPVLRVIGQSRDTYIIAEGPDGIFLIDQHAAHERVLYERVTRQFAERAAESQPLLEPETIELSPVHFTDLTAHGEDLVAAGFIVEPFGDRAVLLRAVPSMMTTSGRSGREALIGLLDGIAEGRQSGWWAERMLSTIACHSAIRAGRTVTNEEAKALIRQLEVCEQPRTCPHGRPTMIHLAAGMLEREFGRR